LKRCSRVPSFALRHLIHSGPNSVTDRAHCGGVGGFVHVRVPHRPRRRSARPAAGPARAALARSADDEVVTTAAARATRPPTEAELEKAKADAQAKAPKPTAPPSRSAPKTRSPPGCRRPAGGGPELATPCARARRQRLPAGQGRQAPGPRRGWRQRRHRRLSQRLCLVPDPDRRNRHPGRRRRPDRLRQARRLRLRRLWRRLRRLWRLRLWLPRGGTSQSLALSLDMRGGGAAANPTRPKAAPPASATATAMSNRSG
jgi:hypothetical protein